MIHLVGLPHTAFDADTYSACAFTTKAVRWVGVLDKIGRDVTVYWGGGGDSSCEVVEIFTEAERVGWFGGDVATRLPDIDWTLRAPYWVQFLERAIAEIEKRIEPGDMVAIWAGDVMQPVVDVFREHIAIEPAVGYGGMATGTHACFESYAWMHNRYGFAGIGDGRAYDTVIPNFIDPDDFEIGRDDGYALFMGRLILRKGPHVAVAAAERAGMRLRVAGAGGVKTETGVDWEQGHLEPCEYVGMVNPTARRKLLAHASVLIVPTLYVEPFGTVHVEALMSGVPVVASDWGVFTETVEPGVDGYRFRTLAGAVAGLEKAPALRGEPLRAMAIERFSMDAVAVRFDEWLWRLDTLWGDGWYSTETYPGLNVG